MATLRFTRDRRGYEHFQLVESTTRRGRTRTRVLYWFRTPPSVKVGREPFDADTQRALEAKYPTVAFDWKRILATPIPSADAEKWRERRREERAAKRARRARELADVESSGAPALASSAAADEPEGLEALDAVEAPEPFETADAPDTPDAPDAPETPEAPDAPED